MLSGSVDIGSQSADRAMATASQEIMQFLELFAKTSFKVYEDTFMSDKAIRQKLLRLEAEQYKLILLMAKYGSVPEQKDPDNGQAAMRSLCKGILALKAITDVQVEALQELSGEQRLADLWILLLRLNNGFASIIGQRAALH